jgi:hypothetical protein
MTIENAMRDEQGLGNGIQFLIYKQGESLRRMREVPFIPEPLPVEDSTQALMLQTENNLATIVAFGAYPRDDERRKFIWDNFAFLQARLDSLDPQDAQKEQLEMLRDSISKLLLNLVFPGFVS